MLGSSVGRVPTWEIFRKPGFKPQWPYSLGFNSLSAMLTCARDAGGKRKKATKVLLSGWNAYMWPCTIFILGWCLHLSSPVTLLTRFVASVRVIFHLGLDHIDSHQWANLGFGMSISREFGVKKDSHSETVVHRHLPRAVEDSEH